MPRLTNAAIGLSLVLCASLANAHHGFAAHYDPDRMITIEGTVRQFDFVNPHSVLHIDATDEAGEAVVYICALQARTQLVRRGADETLFTVGAPIRVEGFPARRDPLGCEFGTGHFADGSSYGRFSATGSARRCRAAAGPDARRARIRSRRRANAHAQRTTRSTIIRYCAATRPARCSAGAHPAS